MSAVVAESTPLTAQTVETVLAVGDLSRLTAQQRVEYVLKVAKSLGLNPFTRPIRFLKFNNEIQAYFTRDGCDQLRRLHNISLRVIDQKAEAGVFSVRVQAKMPSGREDEDIGAVMLPTGGESRANALMKATTKAKRRVTLSICGLGFISEDELDAMPGATVFDADAPVLVERDRTGGGGGNALPEATTASSPLDEPNGTKWLQNFRTLIGTAQDTDAVHVITAHPSVAFTLAKAPTNVKAIVQDLIREAYDRLPPTDPVQQMIDEAAVMDADFIAELSRNAAWQFRRGQLFPPDVERVDAAVHARLEELRAEKPQ
jgi:hypothetical protein